MPLQPGSSPPMFNPSPPQPSRLRASWAPEGAGDCGKSPFWSNLHRPSWFLPRAELGLCNCSLDGPACRAVRRSTALPWRWAVPGVSGAGALPQQVCMGMEGGGGGRCFGLGTGLSSRGSVQNNRPGREKLNRVPQGLNVQDATSREGELLLFATHRGTAPHESARAQLHGSRTRFTPGLLGGHRLQRHKCRASTSRLLPHTLLGLPSPPGADAVPRDRAALRPFAPHILQPLLSPATPHPILPYITHPLITPASSPSCPRTSQRQHPTLHPSSLIPPPPFTPSVSCWMLSGRRDHKVPGDTPRRSIGFCPRIWVTD